LVLGRGESLSPEIGIMTKQLKLLSALVLGAAVILVGLQVFLRYIFNSPLAWVEEVGRYLFIWSVFLGTAAALAEDRHIRITALIDRLGPKAEFCSRVLGNILGLISFSYVTYFGYKIAYSNRATDFYTVPALPRVIFYLAVPVCFTIMIVYILLHLRPKSNP
jgi:C4-dicarboxylate transporter DctQ subunit